MSEGRLFLLEMEGRQLISDILEPAPDPMGMMKLYRPMKLSCRQYGKFRITSEAATCFDVTTSKQAFLFGIEPVRLTYASPVEFHQLMGEESGNGFLTSDHPYEIYSQYMAFRKIRGRVPAIGPPRKTILKQAVSSPDAELTSVPASWRCQRHTSHFPRERKAPLRGLSTERWRQRYLLAEWIRCSLRLDGRSGQA